MMGQWGLLMKSIWCHDRYDGGNNFSCKLSRLE